MPALPRPYTSVRVDLSTREKIGVLRKRLLDQSSKVVDTELRSSGIPLGMVVDLGIRALERELDISTEIKISSTEKDPEE